MKKIILIMVSLLLAMSFFTGCTSDKGQEVEQQDTPENITLRLGHAAQTTHPFQIGAEKFAQLVDEKSSGRIKIEIYPARQLGDDREILEQVMGNTLDMGVISSPIFSSFTPLLDTLQLPFLLNSYEKEQQAVMSDEMKELLNGLESLDIKGLAVYEGGMRHIGNNTRAIHQPDDLKGLKLRVVPSNLILDTFKTLGANPTPMAYGEIYTGLQTNVIDGEEINLTSIYSEKHYEVLKYVTKLGIFPFPGINVINMEKFNSLSAEDQKLIEEAAWEAMGHVYEQFDALEKTAIESIENSNVTVNEVTDIDPFLQKVQPIYEDYMSKDPLIKKFVEMAQKL